MRTIDRTPAEPARSRHAIRVKGVVQGVGFRPAVYRIARRAGLGGFVRNDTEGVWIEVEGDDGALSRFTDALVREAPAVARIQAIEVTRIAVRGDDEFHVAESDLGRQTRALIPADLATCDACVRELFDPADRRHRYPFINCTDCGPRFTIVSRVPYDRANTAMAAFTMCARCRAEYEDPADRRFHAEPNACADCGPALGLVEGGRRVASGDAAIALAIERLASGGIVALKGLGGYQLAVNAADGPAVMRLRARKRRPDKPFAVMARDEETARVIAVLDGAAAAVLGSPARPIVLVPAGADARALLCRDAVAPGLADVGVMLPTTPLHHLLLAGPSAVLVMTSGNLAEEPIARDESEALSALGPLADAFLVHDRAVLARADDSVVRVMAGAPRPVRRARGYVPDGIRLLHDGPCALAVGGQMKSAVCIARGGEALLSQHIGDLDGVAAQASLDEIVRQLAGLLGATPAVVAHDLHPEYASTAWALASGLPRVGVQHHHAHVASCMAESGQRGPVIGVAFDGTGCGPAGELWGGEILLADLARYRRLGHLRPLALPGGEAAIRQPWRAGIAALRDAGEPLDVYDRIDPRRRDTILRMLERRIATPEATGAGRWFDAVASIVAGVDAITYEGQGPARLEALAAGDPGAPPYPVALGADEGGFVLDLRPAVRALGADHRGGEPVARMAARFHGAVVQAIVLGCRRARHESGVSTVALSGGCFQNRLLLEGSQRALAADGFEVLLHARVPCNDGGLALGQAAVAACRLGRAVDLGEG